MTYSRMFTFQHLPKLQVGPGGWRAKYGESKRWRKRVAEMLMIKRARPPEPLPFACITCLRSSTTEPDADNLAISFKPILDAFVREGVLVDDSPAHVNVVYRWEKARRGHGQIGIVIEESTKCSSI